MGVNKPGSRRRQGAARDTARPDSYRTSAELQKSGQNSHAHSQNSSTLLSINTMAQLDAKSSLGASPSLNAQMSDSESNSSISDPLDFARDEGWEDIEPDVEKVTVLSLFDGKVFTDVNSMLKYCKKSFDFDLVKVRADLGVYVTTTQGVNNSKLTQYSF